MTQQTVLLVDDEENVTRALARLLAFEPYRILCANSAREALEMLAENEVQVVISDERMPQMDGPTFLAEVHLRYPHITRMILTGQNSPEAALQALNEGRSLHYRAEVFRFFNKPCQAEDLIGGIREALQLHHGAEALRRQARPA